MKKKLFLTLVVLMMIPMLFTSCGKKEETAEAREEAAAAPEKVTITIESWRNDDLAIWEDTLIPAFNKHNPNIEVIFDVISYEVGNIIIRAKSFQDGIKKCETFGTGSKENCFIKL